MTNLEDKLKKVFYSSSNRFGHLLGINKLLYIIVPTDKNVIEIPVCADIDFHLPEALNTENLIYPFSFSYENSTYKTASAQIRDVINSNKSHNLIRFKDNKTNDVYYGCNGLILNDDFYPILMCLWRIEKFTENDSENYHAYPVIRIDPSVVLYKNNSIEKYIANNLLNTAIGITSYSVPSFIAASHMCRAHIKVEISPCPFEFREVTVPSYSTTRKKLLNTVLNNLDDIACQ